MRFWLALGLCVALTLEAQQAKKETLPPDHADLAYGPHERNKLDLWLAKSDRPTPLIVFIHGGGFVGGDKSGVSPANLRRALAAGVSFAAINYRFRTTVPIQTILRDAARAVQYLRWRASDFNLDKRRVGAMGGSAGAGTSLWLAFHDDLADAKNPDPVLRESTRLVAAVANSTQATYDVFRWPEFLGEESSRFASEAEALAFYGFRSAEEARSPAGLRIRADVDMLKLVSPEDPPVYLVSQKRQEKLVNRGAYLHTPLHAVAVKKACDAAGVAAELKIVDGDEGGAADTLGFLLGRLASQPPR